MTKITWNIEHIYCMTRKTRADLMFFIEILIHIAECVGVFMCTFHSVLFPRWGNLPRFDNNLQIYSRQICSRWRRRAPASWKARHRAASYFINYNEGYTPHRRWIYTRHSPNLVYTPGTKRTFSRRRSV